MKYRKKPVEVEAFRIADHNIDELAEWCSGRVIGTWTKAKQPEQIKGIAIETLEGTMIARPSDYIIKGVQGEFYPCRGDIFEATYEPA